MVDNFLKAAMLKEHVLTGAQLVSRLAELVRDAQRGSFFASIFDTGIAIFRYTNPQVQGTFAAHRETQIGGHYYIICVCGHLHFNRTAIEREQQWSGCCIPACRNVQSAGGAHMDGASAVQCDFGRVVFGGYSGAAYQNCSAVSHLERAGDCSVLYANRSDRLLRTRRTAHHRYHHCQAHHHESTYIFRKF